MAAEYLAEALKSVIILSLLCRITLVSLRWGHFSICRSAVCCDANCHSAFLYFKTQQKKVPVSCIFLLNLGKFGSSYSLSLKIWDKEKYCWLIKIMLYILALFCSLCRLSDRDRIIAEHEKALASLRAELARTRWAKH